MNKPIDYFLEAIKLIIEAVFVIATAAAMLSTLQGWMQFAVLGFAIAWLFINVMLLFRKYWPRRGINYMNS